MVEQLFWLLLIGALISLFVAIVRIRSAMLDRVGPAGALMLRAQRRALVKLCDGDRMLVRQLIEEAKQELQQDELTKKR